MKRITAAICALCVASALPALAQDSFERIEGEQEFVSAVQGKELAILRPFYLRNAITLEVSAQGGITGTALRRPVSGQWRWEDGFFCRDMTFGDDDIGFNCQLVAIKGDEIRFISDLGEGDRADFRLEP